jgi:pimeloyl-ACP methyl ester carboxylesterase
MKTVSNTDKRCGITIIELKSGKSTFGSLGKWAVIMLTMIVGFMTTNLKAQPKPRYTKAELSDASLVKFLPGFRNGFATVNGVKLHYVTGGSGKVLVLLPGWPQTWWSYHKMMPLLAKSFHVIAVDYRGMGSSDKPAGGYDKKTIAQDVYGLLHSLGLQKVYIVGHDIGSQVAFSFAENHPDITEKLVMIDVPHPDESFAGMLMLPALGTPTDKLDPARSYVWWFAFNQIKNMPEELLIGRVAIEQKYIFHYLLANDDSLSVLDRAVYANAYDSKDGIRAGNAWYQAFPQDIADYKTYQNLTIPVLGIGGPGYAWLQYVLPNKIIDLKLVKAEGSGHFVPEEKPEFAAGAIIDFLR